MARPRSTSYAEKRLTFFVFWLEFALIFAFMLYKLSEGFITAPIFAIYNYFFLFLLLAAVSLGSSLLIFSRLKLEFYAIVGLVVFLAGAVMILFELTQYSRGIVFYDIEGLILVAGALSAAAGIYLIINVASHESRVTGFYLLWLLGMLFIMFMPVHEHTLGIPNPAYSQRDQTVAFTGFAISLVGSLAFMITYRSEEVAKQQVVLGDAKYLVGKYDESIECYDRALKIREQDEIVWCNKGESLLYLGLYKHALSCFDKALEISSKCSPGWSGKGVVLSNLKRYSDAIKCYDEAIKNDSGNVVAWNNKGNVFTRMGEKEKALFCYDNAIQVNDEYYLAWYNKGNIQTKMGDYEAAIQSYDAAIKIKPTFAEGWSQKANASTLAGNYTTAIRCFDTAIQLKPKFAEAWVDRRKILAEHGDMVKAPPTVHVKPVKLVPVSEAPLRDVPALTGETIGPEVEGELLEASLESGMDMTPVQIATEDIEKMRASALELARKGDYDGAIAKLDGITDQHPDHAVTWFSKSILYTRQSKNKEALESLDRLLEVKPNWVGPLFSRGLILGKLGLYEDAIESFTAAVTFQPRYADAWNVKGIMLGMLERYDEALLCFDTAIEVNPKDESAWRSKGKALDKLGLYEDAAECFNKALKINPELEEALHYVRKYKQMEQIEDVETLFADGVELAKMKEYQKALEKFEKVLAINSTHTHSWYMKGIVQGIKQRYEDAIESFDRVLELDWEYLDALTAKGNAQIKCEKYIEAIETLDRALALNEGSTPAWSDKGVALYKLEKYKEALACFDECLKLVPDHEKAIKYHELCVKALGESCPNPA